MSRSTSARWMSHLDPLYARLDRARQQFDQRSRRERLMIIAAAVILCGGVADRLWLTPAFKAWSAAQTHVKQSHQTLAQVTQDLTQRQQTLQSETQRLRAELEAWQARAHTGELALAQAGAGLVPASQMMGVLEQLLARTPGVRVLSMTSIAPQSLSASSAATAAAPNTAASAPTTRPSPVPPGPTLYRHGVELSVEGSYAELLTYLRALDALPQRLLWSSASLKVEQHPRVVLTLQLHTLSLSPGWLEV